MDKIPINNETVNTIYEKTQKFLNEIEEQNQTEIAKREELNKEWHRKFDLFEKEAKPYREEKEKLRKEEIKRLLGTVKFKLYLASVITTLKYHEITDNYYERWPNNSGCGYQSIDLIDDRFGSKEYKNKVAKLNDTINKIHKQVWGK